MLRACCCLSSPCLRSANIYQHGARLCGALVDMHGHEPRKRSVRSASVQQHATEPVAETLSAIEDAIGKLSHAPMV